MTVTSPTHLFLPPSLAPPHPQAVAEGGRFMTYDVAVTSDKMLMDKGLGWFGWVG